MRSNVEIEGLNEVLHKLQQLPDTLKKEKMKALRAGAKVMQKEIKLRAPKSDAPHARYDTPKVANRVRAPKGYGRVKAIYQPGNLAKSIAVLKFRRSQSLFVGPKTRTTQGEVIGDKVATADGYYAHWVETGRYKRPFIRPAVSAASQRVVATITDEVGKIVKSFTDKNKV